MVVEAGSGSSVGYDQSPGAGGQLYFRQAVKPSCAGEQNSMQSIFDDLAAVLAIGEAYEPAAMR